MTLSTEKETIITITAEIAPQNKDAFGNWQAKLNANVAVFPGFVSLEIISPKESEKNKWIIVERFQNSEAVAIWNESNKHAQLLQELTNLTTDKQIKRKLIKETEIKSGGITEVFVTEVSPDKEKEFRDWTAEMHRAEAKFPGFKGMYVQSPTRGQGKNWITFLQFDSAESLDRWLISPERKEVLKKSESLVSSLESHRVISPFAGWFSSIAKTGQTPSVWQQTMLVLLVLFPIVMLEFKFLNPLLTSLNISPATFIGNAVSATLIAWPAMPIAIWFLKWWLLPEEQEKKRSQTIIAGTILVLLLYAVEIVLFWSFV